MISGSLCTSGTRYIFWYIFLKYDEISLLYCHLFPLSSSYIAYMLPWLDLTFFYIQTPSTHSKSLCILVAMLLLLSVMLVAVCSHKVNEQIAISMIS